MPTSNDGCRQTPICNAALPLAVQSPLGGEDTPLSPSCGRVGLLLLYSVLKAPESLPAPNEYCCDQCSWHLPRRECAHHHVSAEVVRLGKLWQIFWYPWPSVPLLLPKGGNILGNQNISTFNHVFCSESIWDANITTLSGLMFYNPTLWHPIIIVGLG